MVTQYVSERIFATVHCSSSSLSALCQPERSEIDIFDAWQITAFRIGQLICIIFQRTTYKLFNCSNYITNSNTYYFYHHLVIIQQLPALLLLAVMYLAHTLCKNGSLRNPPYNRPHCKLHLSTQWKQVRLPEIRIRCTGSHGNCDSKCHFFRLTSRRKASQSSPI